VYFCEKLLDFQWTLTRFGGNPAIYNGFMRQIQHNLRKFCGYLFKMQWIRLNKTVDYSAEFTGFHYNFAEIRRLWSTVNAGEQYIMNVCRSCAEVVMGMDTVDFSGSVNIQ
jgi:hypothetical protein